MDTINQLINQLGLSLETTLILKKSVLFLLIAIGAYIVNFITKSILIGAVEKLIRKTKTTWDDIFLENHVLEKVSHYAPLLFIDVVFPIIFENEHELISTVNAIVLIVLIILSVKLINAIINSCYEIYLKHDLSKEIPIKGFIQVLKIVNYFIGGIFFISIIIQKSPFYLLSGLGALTAVLLFVFKDVLLGLVAGIQLTANKMIRHDDWIEMPKYGADGVVLDISLTTVKVNNWDKTITTIPTYALISESFKNWRGMTEAGGRRIKRSISIDVNSISFCSEELLKRLSSVSFLQEFLESKITEIKEHNEKENVDLNDVVNGRRLTNIGVFRAYIKEYLKRNKHIRNDMTFIIRQLPVSDKGLPLEIYVFSSETMWSIYEEIQADIFDHLIAVLPEFNLKLYQTPSGNDLKGLIKQ